MSNETTIVIIESKNTALVLETDIQGQLYCCYYGSKLKHSYEYRHIRPLDHFSPGNDDLLNQRLAYVTAGSRNLLEPALAVTHFDNNNSLVLVYQEHSLTHVNAHETLTVVTLMDQRYSFQVQLCYRCFLAEDVILQWAEISHEEPAAVVLNKYASANLTLSANKFILESHHGGWGREMKNQKQELHNGLYTIDSKLGTRTNLLHSSSFMIHLNASASETHGEVVAASLAWSGNFRLDFETFDDYHLRITPGINNYLSNYTLEPGELFVTPQFVYTYSAQGTGRASRNLHQWAKSYQIPEGNGSRHILLNNWETTYFDFDEIKLLDMVGDTKSLGADLFLLDDGWFGNKYPRNAADAGLGDWKVNEQKLPNGIGGIIEETVKESIKFGIWLEPEMINPKSDLYEKHPEWTVYQPHLELYCMRNQLVLDLSNPQVQEYIIKVIDDLLQDNPRIAFIKWDCNSVIYNAHSTTISNQHHFYIAYTRGLYRCISHVRTRYPQLHLMLCAGGGSRVDYAALQYFNEFWPSDNTNAYDRIFIQWEYLTYFPAISMANHVTDMGSQSLKFKIDVAFMGKLGFDIPVHGLSTIDLDFVRSAVDLYKSISPLIWHGSLYRLQNPYEHKVASLSFVNTEQTQAILLNYYMCTTFQNSIAKPIKMQGLNPEKVYHIKEINIFPGEVSPIDSNQIYSGDFLHQIGFNPIVNRKRPSVLLLVESVD